MFNVLVKREGLIQNDAKIWDVRGGGYCGAIDVEGEVMGGFGECFWSNDDNFRSVVVFIGGSWFEARMLF